MIIEKINKYMESKIRQTSHPSNRASEAGHPCIKYLVLSRLAPEKKELPPLSMQYIFEEGRLHEGAVLRLLQDCGFNVVEQQRPFEWREFQITGYIDAKIAVDNKLYPLEVKSCSPNVFYIVEKLSIPEMIEAKYTWLRDYPAQMMTYLLLSGYEEGIMLFKNKSTGQLTEKLVVLDYEYMESILKKLEKVNEYVKKGEIPEITEPNDRCKHCPFSKTVCFPDQIYGAGVEFIENEEVMRKLERREELIEIVEEFKELDKELKEMFKGKNCIIGGNWLIESKEIKKTCYEIPEDIKEQYKTTTTYWMTNIRKL